MKCFLSWFLLILAPVYSLIFVFLVYSLIFVSVVHEVPCFHEIDILSNYRFIIVFGILSVIFCILSVIFWLFYYLANHFNSLSIFSRVCMRVLRVLSLAVFLVLLWYIMIAPSLKLKDHLKDQLQSQYTNHAKDLAKFDLEKKVYPEIQGRSTKIDDWLITKIGLAGALLGAFLLHLWSPFWTRNIPIEQQEKYIANLYKELLQNPSTCAVLGIACTVSLFMDLHIRRSLIIIQQLGIWAGEYADPILGREVNGFLGWEQFIRMPSPDSGMHRSLVDAIQTGDLAIITIVLFAIYYWCFQRICIYQKLDEFNRLVYWVIIGVLLIFSLEHLTSGNLEFENYNVPVFFSFWCFFFAWFVFSTILICWDASNRLRQMSKCQDSCRVR
jgi:hypothetical protein